MGSPEHWGKVSCSRRTEETSTRATTATGELIVTDVPAAFPPAHGGATYTPQHPTSSTCWSAPLPKETAGRLLLLPRDRSRPLASEETIHLGEEARCRFQAYLYVVVREMKVSTPLCRGKEDAVLLAVPLPVLIMSVTPGPHAAAPWPSAQARALGEGRREGNMHIGGVVQPLPGTQATAGDTPGAQVMLYDGQCCGRGRCRELEGTEE